MEWVDGVLLIAASGVGAVCGILGQSIKEWLSRPRIKIGTFVDKPVSTVHLHFTNVGRKSTEGLEINIVHHGGGLLMENGKVILHTTDMTLHPKTMWLVVFGHVEGSALKIRKSDFGKIIKYSDDSEDGSTEWSLPLPARFLITACARDAKAGVRMMTVDKDGIHYDKQKGIRYSQLESAALDDGNDGG
ncbi:MAG: hypothetical protein FWH47_00810 [Methanomassiliicoccaceae archaeon]|nr:hypothetical protein [Methanomassiliicoccaceae archaeon]